MTQLLATIFAAAYALVILWSYRFRERNLAVWSLIILSFLVKIYLSSVTDVLNIWDEQFHALVAKNMIDRPFTPTLYREELIDHDYWDWARNHVWLHKPPLFLWLIALSIKIFGTNALAVRLPSILFSTLSVLLISKLARKKFSKEASWWATVIFTLNPFLPLLVTGVLPTDHNDVIFGFFITLSYFLYVRYKDQKRFVDIVLLGLAVSACILNKWLLGLWIYLPFGIYLIKARFKKTLVADFAYSVGIALLIPVFWYLYIHTSFPVESSFEFRYNARHFWEALEGHRESVWYYLIMLKSQYGIFGMLLVIPGLITMYRRSFDTFIGICFVFVFFTIAATKMPAFTFWVSAILILYSGAFIAELFKKLKDRNLNISVVAGVIAILVFQMQLSELYNSQTLGNQYRRKISSRTEMFKSWAEEKETQNYVVEELPEGSAVIFMFYTDAIGYERRLTPDELKFIENKGKKVLHWKDIH